jgi:hypothetical protein
MNSTRLGLHINPTHEMISQKNIPPVNLIPSIKIERKFLKAFLLGHLHQLFFELFKEKMQSHHNNFSLECYAVDSKIIQFIIQDIIETGHYTLEGIAYHTRIPFDVIYDAACGLSNQFSITPWARVVGLYLQVKPEVAQELTTKLLEISNKNTSAFMSLLVEV